MRDLGGKLLTLATFVWVTVKIGPWWLGALLFLGAICINLTVALVLAKRGAKP